ncbi:hypothetical protein QN277_009661 [Acacia crassicarpa]|uniref:Disease resistance protein At4g27190-like leucine-rich repeats domain-containing protein n=1 Tax=Acacia crassicarpa TaxID=499986 RepID=A0AAE1M5P4_9FABA|nr:hypothetical protein QN277_009661 [Acacia crassicarpa]
MKVNYVVNRAHGLFTPPLYPYTLLRSLLISELVGLKSLFTPSIVSSLKQLEILKVKNCDTLEHIVTDKEDDHDHMNVNSIFPNLRKIIVYSCGDLEYLAPHQVLFLELRTIEVWNCKSMEYLFSISSGELPQLLSVDIQDAPQLGEGFRWKHGEGQKLVMGDVFPKLCVIRLVNLPTLHTICQGIDFHTVKFRHVIRCPAISSTLAFSSFKERNKSRQSFESNSVHEDEVAIYASVLWKSLLKVKLREGDTEHKQNHIPPNLLEVQTSCFY